MNTVETVKMIGTKRLKRLNKLSLAPFGQAIHLPKIGEIQPVACPLVHQAVPALTTEEREGLFRSDLVGR
jgi:hypothetical protein